MNELEQVERFFQGEMSEAERQNFENAIISDEALASAAAFYLQTRQAARLEVIASKQWNTQPIPLKTNWARYSAGIAATILLLAGTWFFWFKPNTDRSVLANQYIQDHFVTLNATMGSSENTLQQGISLYNQGKITEAQKFFNTWIQVHPADTEAQQLAGITALRLRQYDEAVKHFQALSRRTDLYANSGPFYEAIARLQRQQPGDEAAAQKLLEWVVAEKLPGNEQARHWIK
ncbi:MAG: hypothetical protein QM669_02055 [Siphonobacter sp.]